MTNTKILHLHLADSMGNKSTLIGRLIDGSIRYIFYGGTGASGTPFSLNNIQFYDVEGGRILWRRGRSLPIENLEGETVTQFKDRVIATLNNSTNKVIKDINTNVTLKQ